ncbi:retroviral-like aspartic protease family protein [Candidatus Roizmanbacteria bacterium]|nr:retroviral-like aspartic protease family protein [Candidatus Roizmanbacteria bacterium]
MAVSFPFRKESSLVFGKISRPIANVLIKDKKHNLWQPVTMIIDTGADYTLLPRFMARELGVELTKDCRIVVTQGVGGTNKVYLLKSRIDVMIGEFQRIIPLGFLNNDYIPPLLGRQEFFETFKVVFEKFSVTFSD